jgi:alanyl-tRNA synthetase
VVQDPDRIIHFVDRPVKTGMTQIHIDEQRRQFNTRMHTAGHLIGHFVQAMGWMPIKAHHWPGEGRVQFKPAESAQDVDAQALQQGIEQWIAHDLPRLTSLREGAREIGFGELSAYGCGGTHVRSLKDLGTVTIESLSQKKGTLSVHYHVGLRIRAMAFHAVA